MNGVNVVGLTRVDVVWWSAVVVALAGVVWMGWALLWDRSRGRLRCPGCWYRMEGVISLRCPECGFEGTTDWEFRRTRRRWWWAMLGCMGVMVGVGGGVWARVLNRDWPGAIPSWVLVTVWPGMVDEWFKLEFADGDSKASKAALELYARLDEPPYDLFEPDPEDPFTRALSEWDFAWWVRRVRSRLSVRGLLEQQSEELAYDELDERVVTVELQDDRLEQAFDEIGAKVGMKVVVDWDSLATLGISRDECVSGRWVEAPASRVLDDFVEGIGLAVHQYAGWAALGGVIRISTVGTVDDVRFRVIDFSRVVAQAESERTKKISHRRDPERAPARLVVSLVDLATDMTPSRRTMDFPDWSVIHTTAVIGASTRWHRELRHTFDIYERAYAGELGDDRVAAVNSIFWNRAARTYRTISTQTVDVAGGWMCAGDVIEEIERTTGLTVDVDWQGLADAGVSPSSPVFMNPGVATAEEVLDLLELDLGVEAGCAARWFVTTGGRIGVNLWGSEQDCQWRAYDVSDVLDQCQSNEEAGAPFRNAQQWTAENEVERLIRGAQAYVPSLDDHVGVIWIGRRCAVLASVRTHMQIERILRADRRAWE